MSIAVARHELAEAVRRFGFAYLVTVGAEAAVHVVAVPTAVRDDALVVTGLGRRTRANLAERTAVTLVWPPPEPGGHSLIVDGDGALDGDELRVTPTRAVLHRPAPADTPTPAPADGACAADCVRLPTG